MVASAPVAVGAAPLGRARPARAGFYVPSLDGLRAAAVMLVFLSHAWTVKWLPGNFGVTIFFFLSGYLITTLLRMEYEAGGRISFRGFYLRRILRIFPPFYLVLGLATLLTVGGALQGTVRPGPFLLQAFYLTNYHVIQTGWWDGHAPGTWVYWSLAVEEHFYLAFPLVYLLLRRCLPSPRRQVGILLALCAVVLAWRCMLVFDLHAIKERTYIATDTRVDSILFGCILAIAGNPVLDSSGPSERRLKWLWLPLGLLGLLVSFAVRSSQFEETFRYSLQGLSLFPIFITAIRYPDWGPFRLLNLRWVKFVGVISYTFYLVHPTVIFGVQQWTHWPPALQAVVALAISLAFATGMYYLVERPCARLRKRWSGVNGAARAAARAGAEPLATPALTGAVRA